MSKLISVIIPVYNRADVFKQSLDSLVEQDYPNVEIIVVDDGSDESEVERVASEVEDVMYIRQENSGAPAARNKGFNKSTGEYVIFWDADVIAQVDMLSEMVSTLDDNEDVSFVYCDFVFGKKRMKGQAFDRGALKERNYITTTTLMRRAVFPGFDTRLKKFQDWDLFLTIVENGHIGVWYPDVLFRVETGGTMSTWLPKFAYKKPWKYLPWWRNSVRCYEQAREVIRKKHNI